MEILGWNFPVWLILILVVIVFLYRNATYKFDMFKKLGITGPRPFPFIGSVYILFLNPKGFIGCFEYLKDLYKTDVIAWFQGSKPAMVFYDLEAIKQIMVRDFSNFEDRQPFDMGDSVGNRIMTALEGEHWKTVRHRVSPAFSGSKLRRMTGLINQCGRSLVKNLEVTAKAGDAFACKEYTGSYTIDVIASTFFSIDVDSQNDKNNRFVRAAQKALKRSFFSLRTFLIIVCPGVLPYLKKYFGYSVIDWEFMNFFTGVVERSMKERIDHPEQAPKDFLQMMMTSELDDLQGHVDKIPESDLRTDKSGQWSPKGLMKDDILAQCLIFFLAGYNTVADTLAYTMYHLALYPEVQEKVYQEIIQVLPDGGDAEYDDVKKLVYTEMCIDETLRIYPPAPIVNRYSKASTVINDVVVPKDMLILIPISALHNDRDVWEKPDKFDPERFTDEAKAARHPFQYMPFGLGPRMCVAQRLALLEAKIGLVHIIRNFRLLKCDKTEVPLKLHSARVEAKNGIWLKLEDRK